MVEDVRGGLGYKFKSAGRRKPTDGKRTIRAKLDKIGQLSKVACNFIFEKRWWIVLITGISLVILSVRIKDKLLLSLYFRDPCWLFSFYPSETFPSLLMKMTSPFLKRLKRKRRRKRRRTR